MLLIAIELTELKLPVVLQEVVFVSLKLTISTKEAPDESVPVKVALKFNTEGNPVPGALSFSTSKII